MIRKNRIGIDLDGENRFRLLKAFFNARNYGPVKVERTRHGYHLKIGKAWTEVNDNLEIRRLIGDDRERIAYDEMKALLGLEEFVDTLFDVKKGRDGVISGVEEINPLSKQFYGYRQGQETRR